MTIKEAVDNIRMARKTIDSQLAMAFHELNHIEEPPIPAGSVVLTPPNSKDYSFGLEEMGVDCGKVWLFTHDIDPYYVRTGMVCYLIIMYGKRVQPAPVKIEDLAESLVNTFEKEFGVDLWIQNIAQYLSEE